MSLTVDFTGGATLQSSCTAPSGEEFGIKNTITKDTAGSQVTAAARSYDGIPRVYTLTRRLDTSKTGGTNTSTDVYRMISIPAGVRVLAAWFVTVTAETTGVTATIALGDGDSTAGYMTAVVPSTTVGTVKSEPYTGTATYSIITGKFYAATDTVDVLVGTAAFTNGVYDIYALCIDQNP